MVVLVISPSGCSTDKNDQHTWVWLLLKRLERRPCATTGLLDWRKVIAPGSAEQLGDQHEGCRQPLDIRGPLLLTTRAPLRMTMAERPLEGKRSVNKTQCDKRVIATYGGTGDLP